MKVQFSSLVHAPVTLPVWQTILDHLGNPHPARVAQVLGVGVRTVFRWNPGQQVSRAAQVQAVGRLSGTTFP